MIALFKNYLSATRQQWNGCVIVLMLMMLVLIWPYAYKRLHKDTIINTKAIDKAAARLNNKYHFANKYAATANNTTGTSAQKTYSKKPRLTIPVDINTADSARLTTIYGIGPAFAGRIIKYRTYKSGFIDKEQLKDVHGITDEKYAEISAQVKVKPGKKVNVNTATFDELKRLPYLTYKQMNAIEQYRIQHGNYTNAVDLGEIAILDKQTINKIKPYLEF